MLSKNDSARKAASTTPKASTAPATPVRTRGRSRGRSRSAHQQAAMAAPTPAAAVGENTSARSRAAKPSATRR